MRHRRRCDRIRSAAHQPGQQRGDDTHQRGSPQPARADQQPRDGGHSEANDDPQRSHANDSAEPASSTKLHAAVAVTMSATPPRAASDSRRAHSAVDPMPTTAAISGARATV